MGRQSSRIFFQGKDHKDIYFQGHYHDKMYIGSTLVWEKLKNMFWKSWVNFPYWTYTKPIKPSSYMPNSYASNGEILVNYITTKKIGNEPYERFCVINKFKSKDFSYIKVNEDFGDKDKYSSWQLSFRKIVHRNNKFYSIFQINKNLKDSNSTKYGISIYSSADGITWEKENVKFNFYTNSLGTVLDISEYDFTLINIPHIFLNANGDIFLNFSVIYNGDYTGTIRQGDYIGGLYRSSDLKNFYSFGVKVFPYKNDKKTYYYITPLIYAIQMNCYDSTYYCELNVLDTYTERVDNTPVSTYKGGRYKTTDFKNLEEILDVPYGNKLGKYFYLGYNSDDSYISEDLKTKTNLSDIVHGSFYNVEELSGWTKKYYGDFQNNSFIINWQYCTDKKYIYAIIYMKKITRELVYKNDGTIRKSETKGNVFAVIDAKTFNVVSAIYMGYVIDYETGENVSNFKEEFTYNSDHYDFCPVKLENKIMFWGTYSGNEIITFLELTEDK